MGQLPGRTRQASGQRFANRDAWAMGQPIRFSPHGEGGLGHDSLFETDRPNRAPGNKRTKEKARKNAGQCSEHVRAAIFYISR